MDDLIPEAEIRAQQRVRRLGQNACCAICGEDDPRCLEQHHIAGQAHSNELICICRNCHRKVSDDQRDHPPPAEDHVSINPFVFGLLGLADLLVLIAEKIREYARGVLDYFNTLEVAPC